MIDGLVNESIVGVLSYDRDEVVRRFAENVRERRMARGWSMGMLADVSGLSSRCLGLLESEKRSPQLSTLLLVSAALDVRDPMELLR